MKIWVVLILMLAACGSETEDLFETESEVSTETVLEALTPGDPVGHICRMKLGEQRFVYHYKDGLLVRMTDASHGRRSLAQSRSYDADGNRSGIRNYQFGGLHSEVFFNWADGHEVGTEVDSDGDGVIDTRTADEFNGRIARRLLDEDADGVWDFETLLNYRDGKRHAQSTQNLLTGQRTEIMRWSYSPNREHISIDLDGDGTVDRSRVITESANQTTTEYFVGQTPQYSVTIKSYLDRVVMDYDGDETTWFYCQP